MIGSSNGSSARDRSFLCLLAIYAAHVLLFHVLDVAPRRLDDFQRRLTLASSARRDSQTWIAAGTSNNDTFERGDAAVANADFESNDILNGQLRHEIFTTSSQLHWDSSPMDRHSLASYPKIDFDLRFLLIWIERIKHVFATIALSSSTWGIISGCAIFLLTYTDRDNTLQI